MSDEATYREVMQAVIDVLEPAHTLSAARLKAYRDDPAARLDMTAWEALPLNIFFYGVSLAEAQLRLGWAASLPIRRRVMAITTLKLTLYFDQRVAPADHYPHEGQIILTNGSRWAQAGWHFDYVVVQMMHRLLLEAGLHERGNPAREVLFDSLAQARETGTFDMRPLHEAQHRELAVLMAYWQGILSGRVVGFYRANYQWLKPRFEPALATLYALYERAYPQYIDWWERESPGFDDV